MGAREFFADAVGLGDVRHRGDPAGLRAKGVDQRGHVQAGIEHIAIAPFDAHLDPARLGLAAEFFREQLVQIGAVLIGPVGEGRAFADQVHIAPARHLAEGGVHKGDAALQVHGAHAGEHGVFHGPAEIGFCHQRLLGAQALAGVAPVDHQHPASEQAQDPDQPEQAAADHAQRSPVGLGPNRQIGSQRRDMQGKAGRVADPLGQAGAEFFGVWPHTGQNRALGVGDGDRVARRDFGGYAIAVQTVDGIFGHQRATETPRLLQRNHQLQHGRVAVFARGLVIEGFACGPRPLKQHIVVRIAAQRRGGLGLGVPHRGGSGCCADAAVFVNPGQALDLWIAV